MQEPLLTGNKFKTMKAVIIIVFAAIGHATCQEGDWPPHFEDGSLKPMGCVMGPICKRFEDNGRKAVNCLVDENSPEEHRLPQRLANNASGIEKLKEFCGDTLEMYSDEKTPTEGYLLCCRDNQVEALAGQITIAQGLVSRCPSCWKNFRQVFCELACSPYQNYFMRSVKNESSPDEVGLEDPSKPEAEFLIRELNIVFSKRYAQRTYESCKDVVMGPENTPVMDFICGGYGSLRCSPENWFEYLGDYSNGYTPFKIYFTYPEDTPDVPWLTGLDVTTHRCNESYPGDSPCSCVDCETSCPASAAPQ